MARFLSEVLLKIFGHEQLGIIECEYGVHRITCAPAYLLLTLTSIPLVNPLKAIPESANADALQRLAHAT
jgi:hypothetical protein